MVPDTVTSAPSNVPYCLVGAAVHVGRVLLGDVARTGRECEADRGGRHHGGHPTAMPCESHVISSLSVVQGKAGNRFQPPR